ncbi:MAG: carboxypeptidase regulatory-like domain-containing protein [Deltaproteobacteria bacterium]|nr:carboxypeptidase regulatory-like domain-containing protein [Deltaproteobacteria bacterium]
MTRLHLTLVVSLCGVGFLAHGCKVSGDDALPVAAGTALTGAVYGVAVGGAALVPLAGAEVRVVNLGAVTHTDAAGAFALSNLRAVEQAFVVASLSGYSSAHQRIYLSADKSTTVILQLKERPPTQVVTLDSAPVEVVEGAARIIVDADDLVVESTGAAVSGDIEVSLVPYDPAAEPALLPAPLVARDQGSGALFPLYSYGMTDIVLSQGGEILNVAPGHTLTWILNVAPGRRQYVGVAVPRTYWFNPAPEVFLWEEYGTWSYDAATGDFVSELPHLSDPNVDAPPPSRTCLKVKVLLPPWVTAIPHVAVPEALASAPFTGTEACFDAACPNAPIGGAGEIAATVDDAGTLLQKTVAMPEVACVGVSCGGGCQTVTIDFCQTPRKQAGERCETHSLDACCDVEYSCEDAVCVPAR